MDEPVRYAMILYTDTAVFLNITSSAAALTGIISSTVSYQKGASHRWRLALICFLSRERARARAIARRELQRSGSSLFGGLAGVQFSSQQLYIRYR